METNTKHEVWSVGVDPGAPEGDRTAIVEVKAYVEKVHDEIGKVLAVPEEMAPKPQLNCQDGELFSRCIAVRPNAPLEERLRAGGLSEDVRRMKMGDELDKEGRMLKRVKGGLDMHEIMGASLAMGFGTRMPVMKDGVPVFTKEKPKYQKSYRKVLHVVVPDSEFYDCLERKAEFMSTVRGIPADAKPEPETIDVKAEVVNDNAGDKEDRKRLGAGTDCP